MMEWNRSSKNEGNNDDGKTQKGDARRSLYRLIGFKGFNFLHLLSLE